MHSSAFVASALDHGGLIGWQLHEMLDDASDRAPWKSYEITDSGASTIEIQTNLYYGSAGVSLFLAYLDSVAPQEDVRHAAERALHHAWTYHDRRGIGAFEGVAGLIYVLTHLHGLWKDFTLLDRAVELTAVIDNGVGGDRTFDVFSGVAGAIPILIGLADASGVGLDQAHRCARHLIDHAERTPAGLSWAPPRPGEAAANLTGFAHGTAGIGWALIALGIRTGREEYAEAGMEAFRYEKSHFDEIEQDWYDLRTNVIAMSPGRRHFSKAWCAGAAGIGLSRLASWAALGRSDEELLKEAYISLHATLRNFQGLGNDTLCHGRSGNAELLLRFAQLRDGLPAGGQRSGTGSVAPVRQRFHLARPGQRCPGLPRAHDRPGGHRHALPPPGTSRPDPFAASARPPTLAAGPRVKGAELSCPSTPVSRSSKRPSAAPS